MHFCRLFDVLNKGCAKKYEKMSDVTLLKDVRSVIKICVFANMTPVDTFKLISRGTTNVQRSLVYRWNNKYANGETGVEDNMPHFHRILCHLIFSFFPPMEIGAAWKAVD